MTETDAFRKFNITALSLHISSCQKVGRQQILLIQPMTRSRVSTSLSVPRSQFSSLIIVLSRYMPKKKEVQLKKLVGAGEEQEKATEPAIQARFPPNHANLRIRKCNPLCHIGIRISLLALYQTINWSLFKACLQFLVNVASTSIHD
jgi:hypothetical protein